MCVPWELNPQPFALLTQCSTTEPQKLYPMPTLQKGLWTFLPVNFGALLRKRKHYVETRRLWVYLKREGRETLRRTVIHQNGSKSHQILARSESSAPSAWWAVANLAEQGSTLLRAQGWRAPLPALCPPCVHWPDCRAQQNTGGPVRETQWALLSRTDRETGRYREQVSRASIRAEGKTGEEMEILMEGIRGGLARVDSQNGFEVCCWEASSRLDWKRD